MTAIVTSSNQKYCVILLYIVIIEVIFYFTIVPEKTPRQIYIEHKDLLEYPCCIPNASDSLRSNVVFLKTQGTRSNIVFNILARFSLKHVLDVFIPQPPYNSTLRVLNGMETIDDKYNTVFLFGNYTPTVYEYTYSNTYTITILRDPVSIFEMYYDEYKNDKVIRNFKDFVSKVASKSLNLTFNPLCTQLGLAEEYHNNETEIEKFIKEIEKKFNLVMIAEHINTSLVLLANLMGWPLEYVVDFPQFDIVKKRNFTNVEKIVITEKNSADIALYNYFRSKFENCAIQYGISQLIDEMRTVAKYNEEIQKYCFSPLEADDTEFYWSCDNYVKVEEQFISQIKEEQILRMQRLKMLDSIIIY